jgi:hypothetical protein
MLFLPVHLPIKRIYVNLLVTAMFILVLQIVNNSIE